MLIPYLQSLFNVTFKTGYFPETWSEGYIVPLHKKGSVNNTDNYWGITLLSVLGKLFTRILNNRLTSWVERYNVYIEAEAGFRSEMSTSDNIFVLHGIITHMINQGKKLYCSFIEFSKAFDYVERNSLWSKLIKFGIRGKMMTILKGMYFSVKSRVWFNNKLSHEFSCFLGVRQRESLSAFLFSMFLNNIEEHLELNGFKGISMYVTKLFILLYADDIVVFSDSAEGLQNGLDSLFIYCQRWKLKINVMKTKIIVFREGGILPRNLHFTLNGECREMVKSFSYLRLVFSSGGSFNITEATLGSLYFKLLKTYFI